MSALVSRMNGVIKMSLTSAFSTILPAYMTAT